MIELFKEGSVMAIRTDAANAAEFWQQFSALLAKLIDEGTYAEDWDFHLQRWFPQAFEIACKLRGYKAEVSEMRVLTAGDFIPPMATAKLDDHNQVHFLPEEAKPPVRVNGEAE